MEPIRIAIIEDDPMVRNNLRDFFEKHTRMKVYGAFASIESFLGDENQKKEGLKIILLDIGLPGMSALEGLEYIIGQYPHSDVVMLTSNENPEVIFRSIQNGAVAYLSKKSSLEAIAAALETVCRGESFMSPYIARIVFNFIQSKPRQTGLPNDLTPRQFEIVQGLKEGLSYKMIADRLDITIETVRDHIKNIYRRLQVNSRAEAVRKYLEENK